MVEVGPVGVLVWSSAPALRISWSTRGGDLGIPGKMGVWLISSSGLGCRFFSIVCGFVA